MHFFRNPEIRRQAFLYLVLTLCISMIGLFLGITYGIAFLAICLLFDLAVLSTTYRRYQRIADLSQEIDRILHGGLNIHISEYTEGELSVLQSEITKLTLQLREQAEALLSDKTYLADSIADISHQIRTPLTSINLIVSFLAKPDLKIEKRIQLVQELTRLLSRIDWLISALLKMSRLDAGTVLMQNEAVSVKVLVRKAFEPIAVPMELRNQKMSIEMKGDETFNGDLSWSVEAIGNIIKNCMEHTPPDGTIYVSASENSLFTEIRIRDTGAGIAKEDLPHLFERFYKGKDSSDQSVGIGLALARIIITKQNGTIKAENTKDSGAQFTIRFYKSIV